eukprot:scaffold8566_cov20-Tisochrysis_lutea.AAC.1
MTAWDCVCVTDAHPYTQPSISEEDPSEGALEQANEKAKVMSGVQCIFIQTTSGWRSQGANTLNQG